MIIKDVEKNVTITLDGPNWRVVEETPKREPLWREVTSELKFEKRFSNLLGGGKGCSDEDVVVHNGEVIAKLVCGGKYRVNHTKSRAYIEVWRKEE